MKYLKICTLLLVLILLFAACAGVDVSKPVPADSRSETGTLPEPVDPGAETVSSASDDPLPAQDTASASAEPSAPVNTESQPAPSGFEVSATFSQRFPVCPNSVTAVILNAPFQDGDPDATIRWNDGEYDRLCLIPRFVGSVVNVYQLSVDSEGQVIRSASPTYTAAAENGSVFGASLDRPEGFPAWYVEVVTPDGKSSGHTLEYNGRTGTPSHEFICTAPDGSNGFAEDVYSANIVPLSKDELNAFVQAALNVGLDPWDAADRYFSQLKDIGDSAAFTLSYGHEMDGSVYSFQMAKLHQNYLIETYGLDELVTGQYSIYEQLGNELGILGPEYEGDLPELTWRLTGITVFNKKLAAKEIRIEVNGNEIGVYSLPQDQFVNLIPIELEAQIADHPIRVDITVLSSWFGEPSEASIEAFGGIESNISGAR